MLVTAIKEITGKDVALAGSDYEIFYIHNTMNAPKPPLEDRNLESNWLSLGWTVMNESLKEDAQSRYEEIVASVLEQENQEKNIKIAKAYLASTDWYVSRKAEAGTEIPADVLALRRQARIDASS
jgi:hypothetical protein